MAELVALLHAHVNSASVPVAVAMEGHQTSTALLRRTHITGDELGDVFRVARSAGKTATSVPCGASKPFLSQLLVQPLDGVYFPRAWFHGSLNNNRQASNLNRQEHCRWHHCEKRGQNRSGPRGQRRDRRRGQKCCAMRFERHGRRRRWERPCRLHLRRGQRHCREQPRGSTVRRGLQHHCGCPREALRQFHWQNLR